MQNIKNGDDKIRFGLIFGGPTLEHDISILSAKSIIDNLNIDRYELVLIGVTKNSDWELINSDEIILQDNKYTLTEQLSLALENDTWTDFSKKVSFLELAGLVDFAFPIIHGTYGEDGTIQGVLTALNIPYAGCGILASSVCMDKAMTKIVLANYGIPTCKYRVIKKSDDIEAKVRECSEGLGYPLFVKPVSGGSSFGISKVEREEDLLDAIHLALQCDDKLIVEESIKARELEVAVLGNHELVLGRLGEIKSTHSFYDFDAKYKDDEGTILTIPAVIDPELENEIKEFASRIYLALDCRGYARIDFFVETQTNRILFNEVNTIPGFTKHSMFPMMLNAIGMSMGEVIDRIVELGYEQ